MSAAQKVQQHPAFVNAQNKANYYVSRLDKELTKYPVLVHLEQRTQIPKAYAVIGGFTLISLLHLINPLAAPVSNFLGWGLPAYLSFKTIENPSTADNVQWLTYWVIFAFMTFLESFMLRVLLYYFPWYFTFKSLFILWLQLPAFKGARTLYVSALRPVLNNLSHAPRPVATVPEASAHADTLRERVAHAKDAM